MLELTADFHGTAWSAVRAAGTVQVRDTFGGPVRNALQMRTTGRGRAFHADQMRGFWRNFAEMNLDNETDVLRFVARRGDPFGYLSSKMGTDTGQWAELSQKLRPFLRCWGPLDGEGISHVTANADEVTTAAHNLLDWKPFSQMTEPRLFVDEGGLKARLASTTLAGFMLASAALQSQRREMHMKCENCFEFFATRRRSRYCSDSCRAIAANLSTAMKGQ